MVSGSLSQGQASASNSPALGSMTSSTHNDSDDERYLPEQDGSGAEPGDSWDEGEGMATPMLPEAAMMPDGAADLCLLPEAQDGMLPRDIQRKTAYYDYTAEKALSQADSKLFYQRSQLESQKPGGSNWGNTQFSPTGSPVVQSKNISSVLENEHSGIPSRAGSTSSMKNYAPS